MQGRTFVQTFDPSLIEHMSIIFSALSTVQNHIMAKIFKIIVTTEYHNNQVNNNRKDAGVTLTSAQETTLRTEF